jgi:hypothetical protein
LETRQNNVNNFSLAENVARAADFVSAHEDIDVEITSADGSRVLYVDGKEIAPVWLAAPMPLMEPGQPASQLDITPTQVRLGRWHSEAGEFVSSGNDLSIPSFLDFYKASVAAAEKR